MKDRPWRERERERERESYGLAKAVPLHRVVDMPIFYLPDLG